MKRRAEGGKQRGRGMLRICGGGPGETGQFFSGLFGGEIGLDKGCTVRYNILIHGGVVGVWYVASQHADRKRSGLQETTRLMYGGTVPESVTTIVCSGAVSGA